MPLRAKIDESSFSNMAAQTNRVKPKTGIKVIIVGAGPAGLSAAIRLAQLSQQNNKPLEICVIEKGDAVGTRLHPLAQIGKRSQIRPIGRHQISPKWGSCEDALAHSPLSVHQEQRSARAACLHWGAG